MKLRDATQIIASLEDGELAPDLSAEIQAVLDACKDSPGQKRKVVGEVNLKLKFEVDGINTKISADVSKKLPKKTRSASYYFLTEDGALSTDHPKQEQLPFSGPKAVER